jgi:hypothetical protein
MSCWKACATFSPGTDMRTMTAGPSPRGIRRLPALYIAMYAAAGLTVWLASGCGAAVAGSGSAAEAAAPRTDGLEDRLVPAGYGTLRQDDVTVSIRSGGVLVKVTPMEERTIRLLAPDTYTRLHALRQSRRAELERHVLGPAEPFLVSFFSYEADLDFQPEDVQLIHQGRVLRPGVIIPLTAGWGRQRLGQQETQTALYAFAGPVEYDQPITVRYGAVESEEWRQILARLETERAKILSRVR